MDLAHLTSAEVAQLLHYLPGLGPASYWRLLAACGDGRRLLNDNPEPWLSLLAQTPQEALMALVREGRQSEYYQRWQADQARLAAAGVTILSHYDSAYPPQLAEISRPPPVLYAWGDISALQQPQLAVVGSRHASHGGLSHARSFSRELAANGLVITSGLALGVDAAAHAGALEAGGKTVAVMGTGIDRIYPRRHQALAADIAGQGVVVSEFIPGTQPQAGNFPRRNRLISGLSLGVLVVEAALQSGSLITARFALEHNREVFAIPGSIHNPTSRGCHSLIREGACLVESAADIYTQLQAWLPAPGVGVTAAPASAVVEAPVLETSEASLWALLDYDCQSLDMLVERSGLGIGEVLAALMGLELKGLIEPKAEGYARLG